MQMTTQQILFIISGAITLGAALTVVARRNPFHAALFLILSFCGVAGLYVLLEASFLAAVQLFVCGGIAILIILAVMLTRDMTNPPENSAGHNRQWWAAALVAVALCGVLGWVTLNHDWRAALGPVPEHSILEWCPLLAAALFCVGAYGVLSRRNGIAILMGIELMLNATNINLVAFRRYLEPAVVTGQAFVLSVYAVAAAETVVGLALIVALWHTHDTVVPEDAALLKG